MSVSHSTRRAAAVAVLLAGAALLCFAFLLTPLHTTPEVSAATYDELARRVAGRCSLPEKETLSDRGSSFFVLFHSRFSNKVVGYLVSFAPANECAKTITITCKSLGELPESQQSITPSETCGEVGMAVAKDHLVFILDGFRCDIHGVDAAEDFSETARSLARSIIGAGE